MSTITRIVSPKAAGLCGDGRAVSKLGRTLVLQPRDLLKTWTFRAMGGTRLA